MSSSRAFCVICLRTNKKLRRIPAVLSDYHDELTEFLIEVTNPKYCSECEHRLRKTYNFHKRCKASANILNEYVKRKSKYPIDELHLKLPQSGNLNVWAPGNSKVLIYQYSETPDPVTIKEELVEENVHDETLFKMEVHCESDQATEVLETLLQNSNEVGKTENINENKLTIDNTIPNDITSDRVLNDVSDINDLPKVTNTNDNNQKVLTTFAINENPTNKYAEIELSERNTEKDNINKIVEVPILNDTQSLTKISKITNDMPILAEYLSKFANDKPTTSNNKNQNTSDEENDEEDLVCLDDEQIDDVITLDDDDDMLDDVSLNSDDYLIPLSPLPKKLKVKRTLDQIANDTLSDDEIDDNYLRDMQKTINTPKKSQSLDKTLLTEKEIEKRIETINESLKNLCENWEIPCLQQMGEPNVTNDDIKKVTRQLLAEKKPVISKIVVNRGVQGKLTHIIGNLDTINNQCLEIVEDYKIELQNPKERLKVELQKKFELWGKVSTEDGIVLDKDILLSCIDLTNEQILRILFRRLRDATKLHPSIVKILKNIQTKHTDSQYSTVFNIEYMTTEKEMVEEFERRKTYECYVTSDYKCETCYLGFKFKRLLDYHNKSHDVSAGSLECRICHIRFPSKQALKRHEVHYVVYKCKMCPLVTYYRASMINHYEQHSGTVYQCKLCGHTMKSRSVYTQHQSSMHPRGVNVCTFCGGVFISPLGLKHHITKKHKGEVPTESAEGVTCDKCSLTFPSLEAFNKHDKLLHGAKRDGLLFATQQATAFKKRGSRKILRPRRKPIMTCRVCNAIGHSYGWLTYHLNSEHPGVNRDLLYADKQVFLCDVCGKGFSHKYTLRDHMDIHSGITYPCEKCPKRFPSRASLRTHEMIHNPAGFCCERCGRKFNSKSNLYNHMRGHIGDRRYKCSICGKGFLHHSSLNAHIRGVHNHIRRTRKRGQGVNETGEHGISETGEQGVSETGEQGVSETGEQGVSETGELGVEGVGMMDSD